MARLKLIACEVFFREFCAAFADSPNVVDVEFVEQGLHDVPGAAMSDALQARIDACANGGYDAVLLGYGLCNNGIAGLRAVRAPLVAARAHDCITWFLGCRQRYQNVFHENPGTYYLTSGWIERARRSFETLPSHAKSNGIQDEAELLMVLEEKYGEDNAEYLLETMRGWKTKSSRLVFIDLGVGDTGRYRRHAQAEAARRNAGFVELRGDLRLFRDLVNGPPWNPEDFLTVKPGESIHPSYDEQVVESQVGGCR